jgi:hypothetical protein
MSSLDDRSAVLQNSAAYIEALRRHREAIHIVCGAATRPANPPVRTTRERPLFS